MQAVNCLHLFIPKTLFLLCFEQGIDPVIEGAGFLREAGIVDPAQTVHDHVTGRFVGGGKQKRVNVG